MVLSDASRQRQAKIFKRHSNFRDFRAIQNQAPSIIPEAVVTGSFGNIPQQELVQQPAAPAVGAPVPYSAQVQQQQSYQQPPTAISFQQQQQQQQQGATFQQQQTGPFIWPQQLTPQVQQQSYPQQAALQSPALAASVPVHTFSNQLPNEPSRQSAINTDKLTPLLSQALRSAPPNSHLIAARAGSGPSLVSKLISNATLIRPNIVDGFSCAGRVSIYIEQA